MSNPNSSWPLIPDVIPPAPVPPTLPAPIPAPRFEFSPFGVGLIRPFQRDQKNDFAWAKDATLVIAAVGQILGTLCSSEFSEGELPWRPEFGSLLHLLRHRPNSPAINELAHTYVIDALQRWERRIVVTKTEVGKSLDEQGGFNSLVIKVRFNFIDFTTGSVIFTDLEATVNV